MPHGDNDTWIQTFTGRQFWPLDPRPEDLCIEDIAHALSLKCRYTGHCRFLYSVAQHSLCVAEMLPREHQLAGLMHDASEAYLADLARPIKKMLPEFAAAEHRLETVIAERYGFAFPYHESIKRADDIMLATERRDIMATPPRPWNTYGVSPASWHISTMLTEIAERKFVEKFKEYDGK